ncbi:MAG: hypothetical protein EBX40_00225 [Gammaproteobacteria bacterium]|nr:hypothetical protein [Gammaproteobacteria bacterium]
MKKIKVTEKSGAFIEYRNDGEMLDRLHLMGHGQPERWVPHKDEGGSYDDADVLDERMAEIVPAVPFQPEIPAVYEGGLMISEAIPSVPEVPAVMQKQVKLKAEYAVEITDISQQIEQERINNEALAYLAETDWLIIREMDSGVACSAEIKAARQAAREAIVK